MYGNLLPSRLILTPLAAKDLRCSRLGYRCTWRSLFSRWNASDKSSHLVLTTPCGKDRDLSLFFQGKKRRQKRSWVVCLRAQNSAIRGRLETFLGLEFGPFNLSGLRGGIRSVTLKRGQKYSTGGKQGFQRGKGMLHSGLQASALKKKQNKNNATLECLLSH